MYNIIINITPVMYRVSLLFCLKPKIQYAVINKIEQTINKEETFSNTRKYQQFEIE
jgi:hypothetical protein